MARCRALSFLVLFLFSTFVSCLLAHEKSPRRKITDIEVFLEDRGIRKYFHLYANESPEAQAQRFCMDNNVYGEDVNILKKTAISQFEGYFSAVKLYDNDFVDDFCPVTEQAGTFRQCTRPLDDLWILRENEGYKTSRHIELHEVSNIGEERATSFTIIPQFLGHIFLVKNVCLTSYGHILSDKKSSGSLFVNRYMTGKMFDDNDKELSAITIATADSRFQPDLSSLIVEIDEEILISLVMPFGSNFGHEFLELFPQLFMLKPIMDRYPNVKLLAHAPLNTKKMFPILHAMNIYPERLNYYFWDKEHEKSLYCLRHIVTTTSSYANHVSPRYVSAFREALKKVPLLDSSILNLRGEGILLSDRREQIGNRNLVQGSELIDVLKSRYGDKNSYHGKCYRPVNLFIGNETLEETIRLFRSSRIYISVHGAQMSNIMFMHPDSTLIEIQPYEYQNVNVFLNLASTLGITPYRYISHSGAKWTETNILLDHFLERIFPYIDSL